MDIATMIAGARERKVERDAQQARETEERKAKELADFRTLVERTFTSALRDALALRCEHTGYRVEAGFDFEGETWMLVYEPEHKYAPDEDGAGYTTAAQWTATIKDSPRSDRYYAFAVFDSDEYAEDALLLGLGARFDTIHGNEQPELADPPF